MKMQLSVLLEAVVLVALSFVQFSYAQQQSSFDGNGLINQWMQGGGKLKHGHVGWGAAQAPATGEPGPNAVFYDSRRQFEEGTGNQMAAKRNTLGQALFFLSTGILFIATIVDIFNPPVFLPLISFLPLGFFTYIILLGLNQV